MLNYVKLQAQIEKLQKEAASVKKRELAETILNIKKAIQIFGLTAADLGLAEGDSVKRGRKAVKGKITSDRAAQGKPRSRPTNSKVRRADKRSVVAPKYRDSATGVTWTGRGKQPKWLSAAISSGKTLGDFKI
jgi:DNA-binding protein H-NS